MSNNKRININQIKGKIKNSQMISPNKQSNKEEPYLFVPPMESQQVSSRKILRKPSNQSYRESLINSQIVQSDPKKIKGMLNEYLEEVVKNIRSTSSQFQAGKLASSLKNVNQIQNLPTYLEEYFKLYNYYHRVAIKSEDNQEIIIPLKYKEAKKIILIDDNIEVKSNRNKKLIDLTKQNEDLKKQVFKLRQSVQYHQKRLLLLIEEFKQRKGTYLKQIQKLTNIIQTSIKGIPDLIANKQQLAFGPKIYLSDNNQYLSTNQQTKLVKRESEYNTLFHDYNNQGNSSFQKAYSPNKVYQNLFPSQIQRYKSQGKLVTKS